LEVKGVRQRFRWLPPGAFLMGSHADDKTGFDDECPQHQVTLTEALWLADTACTQALWQAVMGNNPSYVQDDPQKPVEQVSWNDIANSKVEKGKPGFLAALAAHLLPGIEAHLPTEAQWEYACRAGVDNQPYSFGASISKALVNIDHDASGSQRYEAKQTTVAVKALPANAWGLYQMHGNVWEWCADDRRDYSAEPVTNPSGASGQEGSSRALRGGSWFDFARHARSAFRDQRRRDSHHFGAGFRFALRSTSTWAGRPGS
jgi:formylglycine-generating enzyme required for sulfatase activity